MKSMFGYRQHQPYGLSQAIPTLLYGLPQLHKPYDSYSTHPLINRYTHTHYSTAWPAGKVQGLHNTASTIAHSHCLALTYNSLHKAKRTQGWDFQKRCCRW